jgi:AAA15 family ATPase/GTPase
MEDRHLVSFEVSGFKKFTDLKIDNIGQFNLIVGDNNVGKTTLLESLLVDRDYNKLAKNLFNIMFHVKKFKNLTSSFFSYFLSDVTDLQTQEISFKLFNKNDYFHLKYQRLKNDDFIAQYSNSYPVSGSTPARPVQISFNEPAADFDLNIPYIPFGPLYNHELTRKYSDHIQLFVDKKEKLIDSLSHLIENIKNIEVNASYSHYPILLISEKNKNKLSPLATYGDGTVKLFRILLSLFSSDSYNRLMIDELDAGVHHRRLKGFIKSLIIVAKEQKKQIFATTHSKECIEYFAQAVKELRFEEDARIIRLAETKSGIKAYTYNYAQFENALEAESELR